MSSEETRAPAARNASTTTRPIIPAPPVIRTWVPVRLSERSIEVVIASRCGAGMGGGVEDSLGCLGHLNEVEIRGF